MRDSETVLVTGGTGRIGAPLVRALLARGDRVTVLTRDPGRVTDLPGARLVKGSLFDAAALADALTGATVVYHLAGGVRGAGADTADRLNREGTDAVLAAVRAASGNGRPLRAFVYASSCAVYGDRSGLWVSEDYPPSPHTTYGAAKVAAEAAVTAAGLPARIARIAAVYGPGFSFLLADKMRAQKAWLPGEGRNIVPVVHVDDCVAALLRIGDADTGGIFHVAGRSAPTLKEFYTAVHAACGGAPVRFWSTWIPSALQFAVARANERVVAGLGRRPRFTEDNLRLYTASVRLRTDRLEKELGFTWAWADHKDGIRAAIQQAGERAA